MPTAQSLVQRFNDLKTLPDVAIRVSQMACVDSTTIQDFEEVIKLDPVLVMRLLRLVNSLEGTGGGQYRSLIARSQPLPIVGLTAHASPEDEQRCYQAGMTDFMSKPIDLEKLGRIIACISGRLKISEKE